MRNRNGVVDIALLMGGALFASLGTAAPLLAQAARFYTVAPCRAVDTRAGAVPFGSPALAAGAIRSLPLAGACGSPPTAMAIAANVTVVSPSSAGTLTLYPAGVSAPHASAISYRAGTTRANNAVLATGASGGVAVF
ncbi:MAG: hypothetical protein ABIT01_02670, partial [Thermoanaerobaculia bacterium]